MQERARLYGGTLDACEVPRWRLRRSRPPSVGGTAPVIRILIADDHELVRSGLRTMLDTQDDLRGRRRSRRRGRCDRGSVHVTARCDRDGYPYAASRRDRGDPAILAQGTPAPKILVLTTLDLDEYVWEALRAGAGELLLKDAAPAQIAEANVRTVASGESIVAPAVTRRLVERFVRTPLLGTSAQGARRFAELTGRARGRRTRRPWTFEPGGSLLASSSPKRRSRT